MKIQEVTIKKFRSIKEAKFRMDTITAVVGENNAGKTAVLRALNSVLNFSDEEHNFVQKRHQFATRNNTYITIVFNDIPSKEEYDNYIFNNSLTLEFCYSYSNNKRNLSILKNRDKHTVDDNFLKKLYEDIMFVYIPAERKNEDVIFSNNSIFENLITDYSTKHTINRDNISSSVKKITNKIHSNILQKVENQINELYMQDRSVDFKINFPDNIDYMFLLEKSLISLNEYNRSYLLQECGSGTKSLAIIAMYRAYALLKSENIILGIEEPETNLHPQAQKRFISSLKNKLHSNEMQTIFTTHSTVLIDELNHQDILLVRRVNDTDRGFISSVAQIPLDFWERYNVEEFKHYQYFNYRNSDFFFAKYVVLGESKNDCQVLSKLIEPDIEHLVADVSFLDAGGVENLKYPYFLLKELNIPFTIVVDRDFFFPYIDNNILDKSRNNSTGLPMYNSDLKNDEIIIDIFKTAEMRTNLISAHNSGYRKLFEFLKPYKILSMNYSLEVDLTCSDKAREKYYTSLNISPENQTQQYLLVNNHKAIKNIGKLISIISDISPRNYPESYSKIKNAIVADITSCI